MPPIAEMMLMWIVAIAFFMGGFISSRLRNHRDVKHCNNVDERRSIDANHIPPAHMLTDQGKKMRKRVFVLWGISFGSFVILLLWKWWAGELEYLG